jgi:hypothetical protein
MKKILISCVFAVILINATSTSHQNNSKVDDRVYAQYNKKSDNTKPNSKTPKRGGSQLNAEQQKQLDSERKKRAANRAAKYKNDYDNDQIQ